LKITSEQIDILLNEHLAFPKFSRTVGNEKYAPLLTALRESREVKLLLRTVEKNFDYPLIYLGIGAIIGTLISEKQTEKEN
jgi:hypothetical protein